MNTDDLQGEALLLLWEQARAKGLTQEQHARQLGLGFEIYKGRIYRAVAQRQWDKINRPELFSWSLPVEWLFQWEDFMVIGDIHVPATDYEFAMLPAYVAGKHLPKPRRLVIGGDLFNFEFFSKYDHIIKMPDTSHEIEAARNLLGLWAATFDEMYMIMGNHDARMIKKLQAQIDIQDIMNIVNATLPLGKVEASVRDAMTIKTSQGDYSIIHGKGYRKKPLSFADDLAQKRQTHIISHHEHHAAFGMDIYDRYFIINNGGLFDIKKLAYFQLETKAMASMSQAFTMVKGGYPYLFGKWTDWSRWL